MSESRGKTGESASWEEHEARGARSFQTLLAMGGAFEVAVANAGLPSGLERKVRDHLDDVMTLIRHGELR